MMKSPAGRANPPRKTGEPSSRPSLVWPVALLGALIVGGALAYKAMQNKPASAPVAPVEAAPQPVAVAPVQPKPVSAPPAETKSAETFPGAAVSGPSAPAADPKLLLTTLTNLDVNGPITAAEAQAWKDALAQLARSGPAGVATIREYLAKNQDLSFEGVEGAAQLGYPTLRAALIDALASIGGQDALDAMTQTLQTTPYPEDIAALAKALDEQAPGQYQSQILTAARQQLTAASQGALGQVNVGPLFQVLANQAANGVDISQDLQQYAGKWPYYSAITMANLPEGAGVPELIQMAQGAAGNYQNPGAEALAEMAGEYPQARAALMQMASADQLPDALVARLAPFLAGAQYQIGTDIPPGMGSSQSFHVADGSQDFSSYSNPSTMPTDQINLSISLIDQMLQNLPATGDDGARASLNFQRNQLMGVLSSRPK